MQTNFTIDQLAVPAIADANTALRKCVRCGFCTATCPTYVLLGDEADSPRGRLYMMREMLEQGKPATAETVKHIDRCLSCLACVSTCPSGVNYAHVVDKARIHIEKTYKRPILDRLMRNLLAFVMVRPAMFRLSVMASRVGRLTKPLLPQQFQSALSLIPDHLPPQPGLGAPGIYPATAVRKGRVALLHGCVQSVLDPAINEAAIRLLNRIGYDVVVSRGEPCCGSLTHHLGKEADAKARARRSIDQWLAADVEAVVITASGCGSTIKHYDHMFQDDPVYAGRAQKISAIARDITEFLADKDLGPSAMKLRVAYHAPCSLQHGQNLKTIPQALLRSMGFEVSEPTDSHLCCGSAGTYNILQPDIATALRARKVVTLEALAPQVIATGNLGCITQIAGGTAVPIVHVVQLLDWATGGPKPATMSVKA